MEDFTREIKDHNLRKALEIEAIGNQENEEFLGSIDEVAGTLNKSLEDGLIGQAEYERDFENLDRIIQKARPHKYIKREGTPGNYKYYYTLEEYKAAKGEAVDTTEGRKPKEKEKSGDEDSARTERVYEVSGYAWGASKDKVDSQFVIARTKKEAEEKSSLFSITFSKWRKDIQPEELRENGNGGMELVSQPKKEESKKQEEKNQPKFELEQDFINAGFEPLKGAMLDGYTGVGKTPYGKNYKDFSVVYDESSEDLYIEFDSGYGEYLSINKDGVKELVYYETLEDFLNDMNSIFPKSGEIGSDTLKDYLGKDGLEKLDSVIGKYGLYNHIDRGF